MIEIKKVDESLIDKIVSLDNSYEYEKYSKDTFYDFFNNQYVDIFVAFENDVMLGYIMIMTIFDESNLLKIVVSPNDRNKGVGKFLIDYVKEFLRNKNVKKIFLEVRSDNIIAKSFYIKNGFEKGETRMGYYGEIDGEIFWCNI